jgi:hypothetical protein
MNNFSLLAANHLTHLKVVMLALACVTLVVGIGLVHSARRRPFEPHHCRALASVVCATDCELFAFFVGSFARWESAQTASGSISGAS